MVFDISAQQKTTSKTRLGCLSISLAFLIYLLVLNILPLLYTPPPLTPECEKVYLRVANFMETVKKRHQLEDMMFTQHGRLEIYRNNKWIDENQVLSESEIRRGLNLCSELKAVNCSIARSESDMVLFYPRISKFLPHPPGVVFSWRDKNPNLTNQPRLINVRPYRKIKPHWYSSLKMRPRRFSGW